MLYLNACVSLLQNTLHLNICNLCKLSLKRKNKVTENKHFVYPMNNVT